MLVRPSLPLILRTVGVLAHALPFVLCFLLLAAAFAAEADAQDAPRCEQVASAWPRIQASDSYAAIERDAASVANGTGRLYAVEREGVAPSTLFGTMHLSDPRVLALPPAAERRFEAARGLVIETVDVLDPAGMSAALLARPDLTLLPAGRRVGDLLEADDAQTLREALERRGVPLASVETLQPWFVATTLAIPPCEAERLASGAEVLDIDLARRAREASKSVEGLERASEQMEALASLPVEDQAEDLAAAVETLDELPVALETMLDLYLAGRISLIEPTLQHLWPDDDRAEEAQRVRANFEERVIQRRNAVMAERLQPLLAQGGRFVAVGALHLPGETGLVEALRRTGWTVRRID